MLGTNLSHYRIVEQIGAGGMGVVAHDEQLERDVAIKVLPSGTLGDEGARKRFRKEALSLAKLNHPNIATIHDFDSAGETDFLVTEYIAGESLDKKIAAGALPSKEVIHLGLQLVQGLAAAHAQGIIHSDLKPANLRLTADGPQDPRFRTGPVRTSRGRSRGDREPHYFAADHRDPALHGP
jgi:eukaryotic-like serine/threonine-protein kinase